MKNLKIFLIVISSLAVIGSCKKTDNVNIIQPTNKSANQLASGDRGNNKTLSIEAKDTLSIGDSYGGGIIAYILQPGDRGYIKGQTHGLIAATNDQSFASVWCPAKFYGKFIDVTDTLLGSGMANTNKIIAICGAGPYAAKAARNYKGGGHTDWYLPSEHELWLLWSNIGQGSPLGNIGGFSGISYWSSSGYYVKIDDSGWGLYFAHGLETPLYHGSSYFVRAIRAF